MIVQYLNHKNMDTIRLRPRVNVDTGQQTVPDFDKLIVLVVMAILFRVGAGA